MNARVVIFDAYGTLLDVHSAMQGVARRIGSNWEQISTEWRQKHLEYSWVRSLAAGERPNFWELAEQSLTYVAAKRNLTDKALLNDILQAYRCLTPYPEVLATLIQLRDLHIRRAILSNGEKSMLEDGVRQAGTSTCWMTCSASTWPASTDLTPALIASPPSASESKQRT